MRKQRLCLFFQGLIIFRYFQEGDYKEAEIQYTRAYASPPVSLSEINSMSQRDLTASEFRKILQTPNSSPTAPVPE